MKKTNFTRMIFIKSSILLRLPEIEKRLKSCFNLLYFFFFLSVDSNFGKEDSSDTTEEFPHANLVIYYKKGHWDILFIDLIIIHLLRSIHRQESFMDKTIHR